MSNPVTPTPMAKSSLGLEENLTALLAYLFMPVSAFIIFLIEKESKFVKFHAAQGMILGLILIIINFPLSFMSAVFGDVIGLFFSCLSCVFSIVAFALWIILMVKAFNREMYKLPVIGDVAESLVK